MSDINRCKLETQRTFMLGGTTPQRYQEILADMERSEQEKLEAYKNTPLTQTHDGNCNYTHYTCNAGQKPVDCQPAACWKLSARIKTGVFLEETAKNAYIAEVCGPADATDADAALKSRNVNIEETRLDTKQNGPDGENRTAGKCKDNAQRQKAKEQSTANKMLGAASIATTGIGAMNLMSGLAEQNADDSAEEDMKTYLATFVCDFGQGRNIKGGASAT